MIKYKKNLTITIFILLFAIIAIVFYFKTTNSPVANIGNNELFLEETWIDFNSLSQEDE